MIQNDLAKELRIVVYALTARQKPDLLFGQARDGAASMWNLLERQDGTTLAADEIYRNTWAWLNARGCAALVSPQLLERYAMSVARWIQCEEAVSSFGFLARHPTTGNAIQILSISLRGGVIWISVKDIFHFDIKIFLQHTGNANHAAVFRIRANHMGDFCSVRESAVDDLIIFLNRIVCGVTR